MAALATATQLPPEEPDDRRDGKMSFLDHLDEVRTRIIRACLAVAVGMTVVFQIPTVVFFLAKMRLVTARFLWRHIKYAVLIIFIVAAVLTPSADPWNQTVFAAPMIGLYLISIGIAWLVGPAHETTPGRKDSPAIRLVFAAAVIDHARKDRHRTQNRGFRNS